MRDVLLKTIPDIPRWVELRDALLEGAVTVFGRADACVVVAPDGGYGHVMFIVGAPDRDVLGEGVGFDPGAEVCISRETLSAIRLPLEAARRVVVHALPRGRKVNARAHEHPTVVIDKEDSRYTSWMAQIASFPNDLRGELEEALGRVSVAATLVGDALVSFCYPGAMTETLWDIAVDTLEPFQRRGYASAAVARMIEIQERAGRRPVWQAEAENAASMGLAKKLGFEPVDELFLCRASALLAS